MLRQDVLPLAVEDVGVCASGALGEDEVDDEAAAWRAVERRLARWANLPGNEFRQKVAGYLSRRGFDYSTISLILEKACQTLDLKD